jgi:hydrogenase/urease accessory protein HupE
VVVARGGEQVRYMVVVQGVVCVPAGAANPHEAQGTQDAQMVGGGARREIGNARELFDGALAVEQLDQQPQAPRRRERLERLGELLGLGTGQRARSGTMFNGMRHQARLAHMSIRSHVMRHHGGRVLRRAVPCAAFVALAVPSAAFAHALFGDDDPNRPLLEYLPLGFWHMVAGWDHLLFITGVVLLAGNLRTAAKLISLFVAGHSITLLVATLAGWQLDATLVDVVIALSLVYVGVQGWRGRPDDFRVMGAIVFAFGLVHGLGLSTRLQDLGLPDSGLVERVLLFNVGVEIGQLVALAVIFGVGALLVRWLRPSEEIRQTAFIALAGAGLVAAAVISFPSGETDPQRERVTAGGKTTACTEIGAQPAFSPGGGHPAKAFYGPGETAPEEDLAHVLGDGYIIVRYRRDLAPKDTRALEAWVAQTQPPYVIAAPADGQGPMIRALTAERELRCGKADLAGLSTFRDSWLQQAGAL